MSDRADAIVAALSNIRRHLDSSVTIPNLDAAKAVLIQLCERRDLFNFDAFPLPKDGGVERTYLVHHDPDGRYALYVNCGRPGQSYRPHDHGGAWAIVASVQGEGTHRLFKATGDDAAPIKHKATITVQPGQAVSLLPDGIHAISADGTEPLLHLHLYGTMFENQGERVEYDENTGEVFRFKMQNSGEIVDAR